MEHIKKALEPTLILLKELNKKIGLNEIDGDLILKLATTMKVSAMSLEKHIKTNKMKIKGVIELKPLTDDEEE
jgi:hypothetical protein